MRPHLPRPQLDGDTILKLKELTALVRGAASPKDEAETRWKSARGAVWFASVTASLAAMAGGGQPCMYCDSSEASEVEHYKPKSEFPHLAFVWPNYLWICGVCNRHKGNQFPPHTNPGHKILNPVVANIWDFARLDEYGMLSGVWRDATQDLDPRAESTFVVVDLNRQTLQERRRHRRKQLVESVLDTIALYQNGAIGVNEINQRIANWKTHSFQPDVASYYLDGPGRTGHPFSALFAIAGVH